MKIEKIDHICFAVKDLEETKKLYEEDFGLRPTYEYMAESEKIKVARYYIGEVAKFIDSRGEGVFLISYKVDNLDNALEELRKKGKKLIDDKPRSLFGNRYSFVHHPSKIKGVLIELLEGNFDINKP